MRKTIYLTLFLLILSTVFFSQEIIENSDKPLNKNAGRVLKLQEELRITDVSRECFFKRPGRLKFTTDGFIFLTDEFQFLKFNPDVQLIKNFFKKGQGPGEIQRFFYYAFHKDDIISIVKYKIIE